MNFSLKKLWIIFDKKEFSKQKFREKLKMMIGTITQLDKGKEISMNAFLCFKYSFGELKLKSQ